MSAKKSFLGSVVETIIGKKESKQKPHTKKRKLGLETLEVREMLTAVGFHSVVNPIEGVETGYIRLERDNTENDLRVDFGLDWMNTADYHNYYSGKANNYYDVEIVGMGSWDSYGSVYFAAGEKYADITVTAKADGLIEGAETLTFNLYDWSGNYSIAENPSLELTVIDNDVPVNVWIDSVQNAEEGGQDGYIRLRRDVTSNALSVQFDLAYENRGNGTPLEGKAQNGIDFQLLPGTSSYSNRGTATFAEGEEYVDIPIVAIDDTNVEITETLTVTLVGNSSGGCYYGCGPVSAVTIDTNRSSATVEIADNEIAQTIWIDSVQNAEEGGGSGYFRIRRDSSDGELTVYYQFNSQNNSEYYDYYNYPGWAKRGRDFSYIPGFEESNGFGTITFADGQEYVDIAINALDDQYIETAEKVELTLLPKHPWYNDVSYLLDSARKTSSLNIVDNDDPINVWIETVQNGSESGENGMFRIWRDNTENALTVLYELDYRNGGNTAYDSWAKNGTDFSWLPGTSQYNNRGSIVFEAGQAYVDIPVEIIDDYLYEGTEKVRVTVLTSDGTNMSGCCYYGSCYSSPGATYHVDSNRATAELDITDNDTPVTVWIEEVQSATENAEAGYVRIRRDNTDHELTILYQINGENHYYNNGYYSGWATHNVDFSPLPGMSYSDTNGTLTFAQGQAYVDIPIVAIDDAYVEGDEKIRITLKPSGVQGGVPYVVDANRNVTDVYILDDDVACQVWIDSVQNAEEGVQDGYVRLRRDITTKALTVYFQIDYQNGGNVNYTGWAKNGTDFNWLSGTSQYNNRGSVTFEAGREYVDIPIHLIDDQFIEGDEQLKVTLVSESGNCYYGCGGGSGMTYTLDNSRREAIVTILDDDIDSTVWIESVQNTVEEGEPGYVRLRRSDTTNALTVYFQLDSQNGGYYNGYYANKATNGYDFVMLPGTDYGNNLGYVTFAAGQEYVDIPIIPLDDQQIEGTEQLTVTIVAATGGKTYTIDESRKTATVAIEDNEVSTVVWIDSVQDATEGGEAGYIRLRRDTTGNSLTVSYQLNTQNSPYYNSGNNGWATNGTDFDWLPGTSHYTHTGVVTFAIGQEYVDIVINPIDDERIEGTEKIEITLLSNNNNNGCCYYGCCYYGCGSNTTATYTLDPARKTATLQIHDNDFMANVWIDSVQNATEGGESGYIRIRRDQTANALTVTYQIDYRNRYGGYDGYAGNGTDFAFLPGTSDSSASSGSITFAAGQEYVDIPIHAIDDDVVEGNEYVTITLNGGSTHLVDSSRNTGTLQIIDNDVASTVWIEETINATEGGEPGKFVVKRSSSSNRLEVSFRVMGNSAYAQTDFTVDNANWYSYYGYYYGTISFEVGQDTAEVIVRAVDDTIIEISETLTLLLDDASNNSGCCYYGAPQYLLDPENRQAQMEIVDNDVAARVYVAETVDTTEGGEPGKFVVKRTDTTKALDVRYTIYSGSAYVNTDFTVDDANWDSSYGRYYGYIRFEAGQDTAEIIVRAVDDTTVELTENLRLYLEDAPTENGVAQYLLDAEGRNATMQIVDNEVVSNVWVDQVVNATEGGEPGKFIIKRSDTTHALSANYRITGNTAYAQTDFTVDDANWYSYYGYYYGTISFAAGQDTVEVIIRAVDDTIVEISETLTFRLDDAPTEYGNSGCCYYGVPQYLLDEENRQVQMEIVDNDEKPLVWIESVVDGLEGSHNARIILKRDKTSNPLTVEYTIDHYQSTATLNNDYTIDGITSNYSRGTVTFAAGEDQVEIIINVIDDQVIELAETLTIQLVDPSSGSLAQYEVFEAKKEATLRIDDNDTAPKVWIDSVQNGEEGISNGYFRLKRDNVDNAITIYYSITGSADNGTDYARLAGQVTFARGAEYVDIPITVVDDAVVEVNETITLQLTLSMIGNVNQYVLEGSSEHPLTSTVIIVDNDVAPLVWIDSSQNGQEGSGNASVRLRRDNVQNAVTIYYSIGGSASNGSDYTSISSSVTFAAGQEYVDIPINVIDDIIVENEETVTITLQPRSVNNVSQYHLGQTNEHPFAATVKISDNDTAPTVWIDDVRNASEGGENGYFVLRRDNTQNPLTVYFNLEGTASNGSDYTYISSSITFEKGRDYVVIPITIIDDTKVELDEIVTLTLTPYKNNSIDQYILDGATDRPFISKITIFDNDTAPMVWIESVQNGIEGEQDGYFRLRRDNTDNPLTIYYTIGGSAGNGSDYSYRSNSVTFAAGQSTVDVPITVIDDTIVETTETVVITLQTRFEDRADQYILDGSEELPFTASMTIQDNDVAPTVWIDEIQHGVEGSQDGFVRLRRDITDSTTTVHYNIDGTANNSSDYSYLHGSVTFAAGHEYVDIPIHVLDDGVVESRETIVVTLIENKSNGIDQYTLDENDDRPYTATVFIDDNDTASTVWIDEVKNAAEGGDNGYFRLKRDNIMNALTVYYTLAGTATNGSDYSRLYTSVTFAAGHEYVDIPVSVYNDTTVENNETIILTLVTNTVDDVDQYVLEGTSSRPVTGTLTIVDDDVAPNVWIETVRNGEEGGQHGMFRIHRDQTSGSLEISLAVAGTATNGNDYSYISSYVYFSDGQSYVDIPVTIYDDSVAEGNETVVVEIQSRKIDGVDQYRLNSGTSKPSSATMVITDNEVATDVWFEVVRDGVEGSQDGLVRLYRDTTLGTMTVYYSIGGTAVNGQDYSRINSSVTFADGSHYVDIPIIVTDDAVAEDIETIILTLMPYQVDNIEQYHIVGTDEKPASVHVAIFDNDAPQQVWVEFVANGTEGVENGMVRLHRDNGQGTLTVYYTIGGTASNGQDYERIDSQITFKNGETFIDIPITVIDDSVAEKDEIFTITLSPYQLNGLDQYLVVDTEDYPASATVTIFDNDITQAVWIETTENGVEGGQNGFFRICRGSSQGQMTVYYNISGTAQNGTDYENIPGSVTFEHGESYVDVPILVKDDITVETKETVTITLSPRNIGGVEQYTLPGTSLQPSTATIFIVDNDVAPNIWIDSVQNGAEDENGRNGYFRIMRNNTQNAVTVYFSIGGSARNGTDYGSISSSITFAAGQSYVDIPISVIDDNIVEISETITIVLQQYRSNNIEQYILGGSSDKPSSATVTIVDNDIAPHVWIETVRDGLEGGQNGLFRFHRDNTQNELTVYYTIGGSATNGNDYNYIPSSVVFAAGQATVDIPIHIYDDFTVENSETVNVTLQSYKIDQVEQYILSSSVEKSSSASIVIADNDTAPNLWIETVRNGQEGGQNGYFRLRRDNTQNQLTVYFTIGGNAVNGGDYSFVHSSVTFVEGQEYIDIPINIVNDAIVEITETITLTLNAHKINGIDQYILSGSQDKPATAEITIADNDIAPNVWIAEVRDATEGGQNGYFRIYRDNAQNPLTVDIEISGSAINGTDYETVRNTVIFEAGREYVDIPIHLIDDFLVEYNETVTITLLPKTVDNVDQYLLHGTMEMPSTATLTVYDNERISHVWIEAIQNGVEGGQPGIFRVWRDDFLSTFNVYLAFDGTASLGIDYLSLPDFITFQVGEEYVDITVTVPDDSFHELTKTLSVMLIPTPEHAESPYIVQNTDDRNDMATISIIDDETGTLVWIEALQDGIEGEADGMFRIWRNNFDDELVVFYELDSRNLSNSYTYWAAVGIDFDPLPGMMDGSNLGQVTFAVGQEYIDIFVIVNDDAIIERSEKIVVNLLGPANDVDASEFYFIERTQKSATLSIHDNDVPVNVSFDGVQHGIEGMQDGYFRLKRDVYDSELTVQYRLDFSSTANIYSDFQFENTDYIVTFAAGEQYAYISVQVLDDAKVEGIETVAIILVSDSDNSYVIEGETIATLDIIDNDVAPHIWIDSIQNAVEGEQDGYVRLRRDNTNNAVTVNYVIGDNSTATRNVDYAIIGFKSYQTYGTVTFEAGQEYVDILISMIDDYSVESDEFIRLELIPNENDLYILNGETTADVLIEDNDTLTTVWIESIQNAVEGGENGFVRIQRDNTTSELTVYYEFGEYNSHVYSGDEEDFAKNGVDFLYHDEIEIDGHRYVAVTFAAGQEYVDVPIIAYDDDWVEESKKIHVVLKASGDESVYVVDTERNTAEILVVDNDVTANVWIDSSRDAQENGDIGYVRLYRDDTSVDLVVHYTFGGTAVKDADFLSFDGIITFAAGEEYVDIPIVVSEKRNLVECLTVEIILLMPNDGNSYVFDSENASVVVHLTPADRENSAPIVSETTEFTLENGSREFSIDLSTIFSDPDGNETLSFELLGFEYYGVATPTLDGNILNIIIAQDYIGSVEFVVRAEDFFGLHVDAEFSVVVTGIPVTVNSDQYTVGRGGSLQVDAESGLLVNDHLLNSDFEGSLLVELVDGPTHGTLQLNDDGSFVYIAVASYQGQDRFTYRVHNGEFYSEAVEVIIDIVNTVPTALPKEYTVFSSTWLNVGDDIGLLSDIKDGENDSLKIVQVEFTETDKGTLTVHENGTFTFVPVVGFSGTVTFRYAISDSIDISEHATVTLYVLEDVIIVVDDVYDISYGQTLHVDLYDGLLANDLTQSGQNWALSLLDNHTVSILNGPSHGTLQLNGDGSFVYNGDTGFFGTDDFIYRVTDSTGNYRDANVTVRVLAETPLAQADALSVASGETIHINDLYSFVTSNDFMPGTNSETFSDLYDIVLKGDVQYGSVQTHADGSFVYVAGNGQNGLERIGYEIVDNDGNIIAESAIVIVVTPGSSNYLPPTTVSSGYNIDPDSDLFGQISLGGIGHQIAADDPFIPETFGDYRSTFNVTREVSIDDDDSSSNGGGMIMAMSMLAGPTEGGFILKTETVSGEIVSFDLGNGDWFYSEIVTYDYMISKNGDLYWGGYTSILVASFINGIYSYSYDMAVSDNYLITERHSEFSADSWYTLTAILNGGTTETVFLSTFHNTNTDARNAVDARTSRTTDLYTGIGMYGYATEGGSVNGIITQTGLYDYNTSVALVGVGTSSGWSVTGVQGGGITDSWSSSFNGSGTYRTVSQNEGNYSDMSGVISESGHDSNSLSLTVAGALGNVSDWTFVGVGSTSESNGHSYSSDGSGRYRQGSSQPGNSWFISGTHSASSSDYENVHESVQWTLINNSWETVSGIGSASGGESESYDYNGNGNYSRSGGTNGNSWRSSGTISQSGGTSDSSSYQITSTLVGDNWSSTGFGGSSGRDGYDSSYEGSGYYTTTYTNGNTEFKLRGNTTENGSDASSMSYSTHGTLLADGTWAMTGSGSENGSWSEGSSYEGSGTFKMKIDDPRVTGGNCTGTASHDGSTDSSSNWNAAWTLVGGSWIRTSGNGDADYSNDYNSSYEGSGRTTEFWSSNGILYSTTTNRNVNGYDNGGSSSHTDYEIENGGWAVVNGYGSGGDGTSHHHDGKSNGTYSYKKGDEKNGSRGSGSVDGEEDGTQTTGSSWTSEWVNGSWFTEGNADYGSSGSGEFNTNGDGSFWVISPTSSVSGTIDESSKSDWNSSTNYTETYKNGVFSLDSGNSSAGRHEENSSTWNGEGNFSQKGYTNGVYTELSGTLEVERKTGFEYDWDESKDVDEHSKQWTLTSGSMNVKNTYFNATTKDGTGKSNVGDKSYDVTSFTKDTVDTKYSESGSVKQKSSQIKEWMYSGDTDEKSFGNSLFTTTLKSASYKRDIKGGQVSGTVRESEVVSNSYDNKVTQKKNEGEEGWVITSGSSTIESTVGIVYSYDGSGNYAFSDGGVFLKGSVQESGSSGVSSEGYKIVSVYDTKTKQWKDTTNEGVIKSEESTRFSDVGNGSYFVAGGTGTITNRSATYDYSYSSTLYLESQKVEYKLKQSESTDYGAVEKRNSYNGLEGDYILTRSTGDSYNEDASWTCLLDEAFEDYDGSLSTDYYEKLGESFSMKAGNDTYDSYSHKVLEDYSGDVGYKLELGKNEDKPDSPDVLKWVMDSGNATGKIENELNYKTSSSNVLTEQAVGGMSFVGLADSSNEVRYEFSRNVTEEYKGENGKKEWTVTESGGKTKSWESHDYSFKGFEQEYEYHNSTGTRNGDTSWSSSADTELGHKLKQVEQESESGEITKSWKWQVTGSSTVENKYDYSWDEHASATVIEGDTTAHYSHDADGNFTDESTVRWKYDNGGWTATSVDGQGNGAYNLSDHYDASRSGSNGFSGAPYTTLDINYSFDNYDSSWSTSSDTSAKENVTVSYAVAGGSVVRNLEGESTEKQDRQTEWNDSASYSWSDSTHHYSNEGNHYYSSYLIDSSSESSVEATFEGSAKDTYSYENKTTWKNGSGGYSATSDVTYDIQSNAEYTYSYESKTTGSTLNEFVWSDGGPGWGAWDTCESSSSSDYTWKTDRTENYDVALNWTYTIDHNGVVSNENFGENISGSGEYTYTVDGNSMLDRDYTHSESHWGGSVTEITVENTTTTEKTDNASHYHFSGARNSPDQSKTLENEATLKEYYSKYASGDGYRYRRDPGSETTKPLDFGNQDPVEKNENVTNSSPGFLDGMKSLAGTLSPSQPGRAGASGVHGDYDGRGMTSPGSGDGVMTATVIGAGLPSYENMAPPDVGAILEEVDTGNPALSDPVEQEAPDSVARSDGGGWADWLNQKINATFFDVKFNTNNENFKQVRAQNQVANEIAGTKIRPDRGAYDMAKTLVRYLPAAGAIVNAEIATDTSQPMLERIMAGVSLGLSALGTAGSIASTEFRMCKMVCFTAGTPVVVGEEIIQEACTTEIIHVQSFDGYNVFYAGLGFGLVGLSLTLKRKKKSKNKSGVLAASPVIEDSIGDDISKQPILSEIATETSVMVHEPVKSEGKIMSRFRSILAMLFFVLAIFCGYLALPTSNSIAISQPEEIVTTAKRLVMRGIEDVEIGQRVLGRNPEVSAEERAGFVEPTSETQYRYDLLLPKSENDSLTLVRLLRPRDWLDGDHVRIVTLESDDGVQEEEVLVWLELPEMGAVGWALLADVDEVDSFENGPGNIVTGKFVHLAESTLDLLIEDAEPIGCTPNHPFWSFDRHTYVNAGELREGERILLYSGETKRVVQKLPRPGPEVVYNIEVFGEHVYHVGEDGVLVHNECEMHHFATNKSLKSFTPQFEQIIARYGLKLHQSWNMASLPHRGRHAKAYHQWVLDRMKKADRIANGDLNKFLKEYTNRVIKPVTKNPKMMYRDYWKNR